ncbi:MAG: hypothetical protein K5930_13230 [Treponemataceae bacterium]|nr:hypothetical protein [Treponemataceae bacterium]
MKSREAGYFYAHPQNRFWSLLGKLFGEGKQTLHKTIIPITNEEKKAFLLENHIAVCLPSSSPANETWTFDKLYEEWKRLKTLLP